MKKFVIYLSAVIFTFSEISNTQHKTKRPLINALGNFRDNLYKKVKRDFKRTEDPRLREFSIPAGCATILDAMTTIELRDPNTLSPELGIIANEIWQIIWLTISRQLNGERYKVRLTKDASYNFTLSQFLATDLVTPIKSDDFLVGNVDFEESTLSFGTTSCLIKAYDPDLLAVLIDVYDTFNPAFDVFFFCIEPRIHINVGEASVPLGEVDEVGGIEIDVKFYNLCTSPESVLGPDVLSIRNTEYKKI